MKTLPAFLLTTLLALPLASEAGPRERNRERSGQFTTSRGDGGAWQRQIEAGGGQRQTLTEWQNARGTGTRETQAGTQTRTTTLPGGATSTAERSGQRTGAGTWELNGNRTGFNGNTQTGAKTVTRTGEGTAAVQGTVTGANGKSLTTSGTIERTGSGMNRSGTWTSSEGTSGTYNSSTTRSGDGTATRSSSVAHANGKTASKEVTVQKTEDGATRTVTTTGPGGQTRTRSGSATTNPPASENSTAE